MSMARAISARSVCSVRQVGAAVSSADHRQWAFGYNGPPAGFTVADRDVSPLGCKTWCPQGLGQADICPSVHAEINAIAQSDRAMREGGTFYVTDAPCWKCALAVMNSGVRCLVTPHWEEDRTDVADRVQAIAEQCKVDIKFFP